MLQTGPGLTPKEQQEKLTTEAKKKIEDLEDELELDLENMKLDENIDTSVSDCCFLKVIMVEDFSTEQFWLFLEGEMPIFIALQTLSPLNCFYCG